MNLLFFFVSLCMCSNNTQIYQSFVDSLFLRKSYISSCKPIDDRKTFVKELEKVGISTNLLRNYYMEYIIDKNESLYKNKNILGNLIMTRADWSIQIRKLPQSYAEREKRNVFGEEIFESALKSVTECDSISKNDTKEIILIAVSSMTLLYVLSLIIFIYYQNPIFEDNSIRNIQGIEIIE